MTVKAPAIVAAAIITSHGQFGMVRLHADCDQNGMIRLLWESEEIATYSMYDPPNMDDDNRPLVNVISITAGRTGTRGPMSGVSFSRLFWEVADPLETLSVDGRESVQTFIMTAWLEMALL